MFECTEKRDENDLLKLAASAEKGSEHTLGEAIVERARELGVELDSLDTFNATPGHGIEAKLSDRNMLLGNKRLMDERLN